MLCHRWIAQCNHWTEWLTNTTDQVSAYIHDIQYNDLHGVKQIQLLNSGMTANTDQQYKITNDWWFFCILLTIVYFKGCKMVFSLIAICYLCNPCILTCIFCLEVMVLCTTSGELNEKWEY